MFALILRIYAYLYHLVLALFLLGITLVSLLSARQLRLDVVPWKGEETIPWVMGGAVLGLLSIALAVTGLFRFLFPLWALSVLIVLVRGYIIQPYSYGEPALFYQALWLIAGALLAFLASLTLFARKRRRSKA